MIFLYDKCALMGLLYNQLYNSQAVSLCVCSVSVHCQHTLCAEEREHFALSCFAA